MHDASVTRYADGPTTEVDVLVDATVEALWPLVTDLDLPARFSSEFRGATWLERPPSQAARFVGRSGHPALGEWETTSYVSRYEPPRVFAWNVGDLDNPSASWWYYIDQLDSGVRLRHGVRIGPAPSGLTYAITAMPDKEERIIARRLQEFETNMTATLLGIKELAEVGR